MLKNHDQKLKLWENESIMYVKLACKYNDSIFVYYIHNAFCQLDLDKSLKIMIWVR